LEREELHVWAWVCHALRSDADFLSKYEVRKVGGSSHLEYWIPAEELSAFNENIAGAIEVIAEFRREGPA